MNRIYSAWIARDKNDKLRLFNCRPMKLKWFGEWIGGLANLNPEDFPDVTWENSPQKVDLIIRKSSPNEN